jgi:uncharacterized protein (TIGR02099 family)
MPSTAPASSRVDRVVRFAAKAAVVVVGTFFALLLGIRVVVYPQLEAHRVDIARWLGERIGQPVEIDDIVTGWNGWNPRLSIRGFRVHERTGTAILLDLPRVDLLVAWTSLPRLDLRLKELTIDSPRLGVRRDTQGRLHLAGLEMTGDDSADDSPFANWVLRQPQVIVRDALVAWNDELRHAPQLLLDHVQFRLEQRFGRHEAGLTGVPPPEVAGPIDMRADLTGMSRRDFSHVRGRLYFRLDYADVAAWREWLPLPFAIESGRGALRAWVDVADGQARGGVADLELADVRTTLGDHLEPLALTHLAGRAEWKQSPGHASFKASRLAFELPDGTRFGPTDLALALDEATPAAAAGGRLAVGEIELQPLAAIASHLPLHDAVRRDIVRFAPHGSVRDARVEWTGELASPQRYLIAGNVRRFAVASHDGLPGVAGIAGSVEMNERGGRVHVAGDASTLTTLTLPRIFADPLTFDGITGDVRWQTGTGTTRVEWKGVDFANADVAGTTDGTWTSGADRPGSVDITGQLTRANLASTYRYVPVVAPPALREWLRRALVKGSTGEARLALAGDLAFFPFGQGKEGRFELDVKARDVTLAYADRWAPITDVAGDVRVDGAHVVVDASGARMNSVDIGATRAEIADLRDARPVLRIKGTARGPTPQFLAFIAASPVAEWIDHVTDGITASGDGDLALEFALPLHDPGQATLTGNYRFASSAVQLAPAVQLDEATGALAFDEHGVRATGVTAQAFGGPVTLALTAERGRLRLDARGSVDVARVRTAFDAPALARVSGNTDWQLALDAQGGQMAWTLQSSLAGATVDLPAPIGKVASEALPLRVERRATKPQEDTISVDYGRIARMLIHRQTSGTTTSVDRALVLVGKAIGDATPPERAGVWIRADVTAVDVDAWLAVDPMPSDGAETTASAPALAIDGVDLQAATATALGRNFHNVKATARRRDGDWRVVLDGSEIAGDATWRSATPGQPHGRITARLARLSLPPATQGIDASATTDASDANHWAAVDLVADSVIRKGRALGKLELVAQPSGKDWQITKLSLASDAGRIDAHGSWRDASTRSQTQLDVAIDVREAGAFLGRFGWPDAVKGAPTKIEGQVSWAGSPSDFDYPSLAGRLTLRTGAGQFTKLEPGMGRLLGVLSLQALPRRVSLDFRDVFSEGFAFDTITGDVRIDRGVMHTDNLRLSGPAAGVDIAGDVDLSHETQRLDVRVQPSLSTGVSAGAAALFIANPLLGAAIGAGTLLAQKMLNNPFDQLFSYRYAVSGSFDDPVVARANARAASVEPSSATVR